MNIILNQDLLKSILISAELMKFKKEKRQNNQKFFFSSSSPPSHLLYCSYFCVHAPEMALGLEAWQLFLPSVAALFQAGSFNLTNCQRRAHVLTELKRLPSTEYTESHFADDEWPLNLLEKGQTGP